ncbi:MAG: hypothetical protein M1834_003598 [Cirrosporium novae-zelandiae]|nr:MAG: hypothetical protein M1834_003598 [Cirrosporium novae-zelandiae]
MMLSTKTLIPAILTAAWCCQAYPYATIRSSSSYADTLPAYAKDLFDESMNWMDTFYDPSVGYLYENSAAVALRHDVRHSAWYAVGLLARNNGSDAEEALKIISNVCNGQFKNASDQWYGTYQKESEEPLVGTSVYPANIYNSWDPNWRGFISCAFIMALEEFGDLITPEVTKLLHSTLYISAKGDSYRVGGVDGDNLYSSYSNPAIMRAFSSGWTGRLMNDTNMTQAGENYAQDIIDLFDLFNTLPEFNSPTYTGISLWGLTLWAKYLPSDSIMSQNAASMIKYTWEMVAQLYHPQLSNLGGPWDRTYGFDMTKYIATVGLHMWNLVGKDKSPFASKPLNAMSHGDDGNIAPLFAILASFHNNIVPANVSTAMTSFIGEHTVSTSAIAPPYDTYARNVTAWLANNISIGAETINETVIGGPRQDANSYRPGIIQWNTGNGIGWLALQSTEAAIHAIAGPGTLDVTYLFGNDTSQFQILVSQFAEKRTLQSWEDIQGLSVKVSGNIDLNYTLSFAGDYGGADDTIDDFEFWNFTYSMPTGSTETPNLLLEVELE